MSATIIIYPSTDQIRLDETLRVMAEHNAGIYIQSVDANITITHSESLRRYEVRENNVLSLATSNHDVALGYIIAKRPNWRVIG